MESLWIPLTVGAAAFQAVRTALQRELTGRLSATGSAYTRFLFGAPLAWVYLSVLAAATGGFAAPNGAFAAWLAFGAVGQIVATILLIHVLTLRNFAVGIAYSKTELIQAAVFGFVFLGDAVTPWAAGAILVATAGVLTLSLKAGGWRAALAPSALLDRTALLGLLSGGLFAVAAVGFRGAALALPTEPLVGAAHALAWATTLQTALMTGWLALRDPRQFARIRDSWRPAALVGAASMAGSTGWFTAMALQQVAHVRTLGLVELPLTILISRLWFRERARRVEIAGIVLIGIGIAMLLNPP